MRSPYVAFSTGKDSTVIANLVREVAPETPLVYFDAKRPFPESAAMLAWAESTGNLIRYDTGTDYLDLLRKYGLSDARIDNASMEAVVWGPVKRLCAEYGFDGAFLGLRASESKGRRHLVKSRGALFYAQRHPQWECLPICDWSVEDVWAYLVSTEAVYNGVYDRLWEWGVSPDEMRVCYWCVEVNITRGNYVHLKRGWPQLWDELVVAVPEAASYG